MRYLFVAIASLLVDLVVLLLREYRVAFLSTAAR